MEEPIMEEPIIRVVHGTPSAEELAALTVAILRLTGHPLDSPEPQVRRPGWSPGGRRRWAHAEPYVVGGY
jgi:hypothetical protein